MGLPVHEVSTVNDQGKLHLKMRMYFYHCIKYNTENDQSLTRYATKDQMKNPHAFQESRSHKHVNVLSLTLSHNTHTQTHKTQYQQT